MLYHTLLPSGSRSRSAPNNPSSVLLLLLLLLKDNIICPKPPTRHAPLKQDIDLLERPAPRLRQPLPTPHPAADPHAPKQEASLPLPIRLVGVQHVRHGDGRGDAGPRLDGRRDRDGRGPEPRRGDLGEEHEC